MANDKAESSPPNQPTGKETDLALGLLGIPGGIRCQQVSADNIGPCDTLCTNFSCGVVTLSERIEGELEPVQVGKQEIISALPCLTVLKCTGFTCGTNKV